MLFIKLIFYIEDNFIMYIEHLLNPQKIQPFVENEFELYFL